METRHTPGPWRLDRRQSCWAIVDASGQDVAYQDDAPRFHAGEPCGSITSRGRTAEELEANAALIAAAPDLLAALKTCREALAWYETQDNERHERYLEPPSAELQQADAAIAKAQGVTHAG